VVATLAFTGAFIYFSASSFWRARRHAAIKDNENG